MALGFELRVPYSNIAFLRFLEVLLARAIVPHFPENRYGKVRRLLQSASFIEYLTATHPTGNAPHFIHKTAILH